MSSVASTEGDLVYAVMGAPSSKALRALEKPLDTNEFCSLRLGRGRTSLTILATVGVEAVGVALVSKDLYLRAGASGPLPDGLFRARRRGGALTSRRHLFTLDSSEVPHEQSR